MELSMMQSRSKSGLTARLKHSSLDRERGQQLIDSLYAIAQADGKVSSEEIVEIQTIAQEFGIDTEEHA